MTDQERRRLFRRALLEQPVTVAPGAHDALTARIIEQAGFAAVYVSGSAVVNTIFGVPDVGLVTQTEMTMIARCIAQAVTLPVIADADAGYGNAINVGRTVREYEMSGVVAIHIEDQVSPKRSPGPEGKHVVSDGAMIGKIRAALDARTDPDFMIIARTDSCGSGGMEEVVRRCRLYLDAGADMVFPTGITRREELERLARDVPGPKLYNMGGYAPGKMGPRIPFAEAGAMGFKLVILPMAAARAGVRAIWDFVHALKAGGPQFELEHVAGLKGHPVEDWYSFTGLGGMRALEEKYLPAEGDG
jgi:2-methylisocitrate lyase-like PEP mutase family enzyme